jgi:hypothetical protein
MSSSAAVLGHGALYLDVLPNKALQLTRRRRSTCDALQPSAARFGVDSAGGRRLYHLHPRAARS